MSSLIFVRRTPSNWVPESLGIVLDDSHWQKEIKNLGLTVLFHSDSEVNVSKTQSMTLIVHSTQGNIQSKSISILGNTSRLYKAVSNKVKSTQLIVSPKSEHLFYTRLQKLN